MRLLISLLVLLFPLSAFAESPTFNQPTIVVVPDGKGSVQYRLLPHGLDPLTALTIGDGLSQIGARHRERTSYVAPPLTVPDSPSTHYQDDPVGDANKVLMDYLNHR